jgi:hypothetical protein
MSYSKLVDAAGTIITGCVSHVTRRQAAFRLGAEAGYTYYNCTDSISLLVLWALNRETSNKQTIGLNGSRFEMLCVSSLSTAKISVGISTQTS